MFNKILSKIFGSRNERIIKNFNKIVVQVNQLSDKYKNLSDHDLKASTARFKQMLAQGVTLDNILPDAFAVVREVSSRTIGLRHFDVQILGGLVLHAGKIAEMRTGEGKTLVATLAAYLNALTGKGVHIITVNDYLAKRDSEWMGPIYKFLDLTVGVVIPNLSPEEKRQAYRADIIYGTNNEFGFDYLRDNMVLSLHEKVQREINFAIVDEVDSILIDEARTPLIISGATDESSELYEKINVIVPQLSRQLEETGAGDYYVDEKVKQAFLTEIGHQKVEGIMQSMGLISKNSSLYSAKNINLMHYLNASLRAHSLYKKDVEYVVRDNQIVIVDEHTGRTMLGRRWSEGLHQAIEAKEKVPIQNENQTLASITFQNYFRLYNKLSGMTGTADTEAYEFQQIYNLEVIVVPTHMPMIRRDESDLVFLNIKDKYDAIINDINDCQKRGQPVLVGTASIEASEILANLLQKNKITHQVLNAKFHEREAHIIAEAGRTGGVTIATNMAGRGTDIVLGGSIDAKLAESDEEISADEKNKTLVCWKKAHRDVVESGGLRVIGSERHESRRIDNQLRGRSGRQGDPGSSRFYLSLEDNLLRIFASDKMSAIMKKLGMKEGDAIESNLITKAIENAQRKVEGHNFDIRKQLLDYDNVANEQRQAIYKQRNELLESDSIQETIDNIKYDVIQNLVNKYVPIASMEEQWDVIGLEKQIQSDFSVMLPISAWLKGDDEFDAEVLNRKIQDALSQHIEEKEKLIGSANMRHLEKTLMLQIVDLNWRQHLSTMDHLRHSIHLRGYAQKDPKQEYKREAFLLFNDMLDTIKYQVISMLSNIEIKAKEEIEDLDKKRQQENNRKLKYEHDNFISGQDQSFDDKPVTFVRSEKKIGRNDPCPCGSNKKYKQCHGKI